MGTGSRLKVPKEPPMKLAQNLFSFFGGDLPFSRNWAKMRGTLPASLRAPCDVALAHSKCSTRVHSRCTTPHALLPPLGHHQGGTRTQFNKALHAPHTKAAQQYPERATTPHHVMCTHLHLATPRGGVRPCAGARGDTWRRQKRRHPHDSSGTLPRDEAGRRTVLHSTAQHTRAGNHAAAGAG